MRLLFFILALISSLSVAQQEEPKQPLPQKSTYLTDKSITGHYQFTQYNLMRDVKIDTPIKGKFYFKFFIAQTPIKGMMSSALVYSEIDGVAVFNKENIATYLAPDNKCFLKFYFTPLQLLVEQNGNCNMPIELGYEAAGLYNQLETFENNLLLTEDY